MIPERTGSRAAEQLGLPGVDAPLPGLLTARYAVVDPARMVPIQTSIGRPGWLTFELVAWRSVAPFGLLEETDHEVFRRKYRYRLHQRTSRILEELAELRATYDGWPLALCCFEDIRHPESWCHRRFLAEWLAQKLGEDIPDLEVRS
jgi:hypothetical protein